MAKIREFVRERLRRPKSKRSYRPRSAPAKSNRKSAPDVYATIALEPYCPRAAAAGYSETEWNALDSIARKAALYLGRRLVSLASLASELGGFVNSSDSLIALGTIGVVGSGSRRINVTPASPVRGHASSSPSR